MKNIKFILPFLIIPFIGPFSSFKERSGINELTEKILTLLEQYVLEVPEEKVFLHLDKPLYAAGEDIWFSVYLTAGSPDIPSPLSKVVYVDLLDHEGTLLQQRTIPMEEGHGFGDFWLENFMPEGVYEIKAYTHWLRGFGTDAVFSQTIEVLEPYNLKFQPSVRFEKEEKGNSVSYKAEITALNKSLQPLKEENLQFSLVTKGTELQKGDFSLDDQGKYQLEFQIPLEQLQQVVALSLSLKENEEYTISRKFILPFSPNTLDIQFLPEGGELVAGFSNKVAVRAVYPDGSPVSLTGKIKASGEEISFHTNESGLGVFNINPVAGENYHAVINIAEEEVTKALPEVRPQGINLAVDNRKEGLVNVLIQAADFKSISPSGEGLLVVHARGRIGHMQKINLSNGVTGARINKSQLPAGINQITVFEPEGRPLAERLIFIPFEQEINVKLETAQVDGNPRARNTWNLHIEGENFEKGNYSIAITDAHELPFGLSSNIVSYLKLESELKGNIHEPSHLLGNGRDDEGIDLIMLTHGWRRFNWDEVMAGKFENPNFIEQGINITGTVTPKNPGKRGLTGGTINVYSRGDQEDFMVVNFADNGKFIIDDLLILDTTQLTLMPKDDRHKELLELELDAPLAKYEKWEGFDPPRKEFFINPSLRDFLSTAEKRRQASVAFNEMDAIDIEEFVLKSQRIDPEEEQIVKVYGRGDNSIKPEDIGGFEGYYDIWQLLQGRVAGVSVKPNPMGAPNITIRGTGSVNALSPMFLLDNVPVDAGFLSTVSPRDVAVIDIFKDGASLSIFGSGGAGGVIAVYTKRGSGIASPTEGVFNLRYPGFSTAREYYTPKYDQGPVSKPDFRSTLYWNPKIKWTGNTAAVEFYNNDVVKKYKVIVQGMDSFGRLTYLEKEITP